MNTRAAVTATAVGTVMQLAMVLVGHSNPAVAALFGPVGMTISLVAGVLYALAARGGTRGGAAFGGLVAGGACALIGICVSYALGDVTAAILALGTLSSAVAGALGGFLGALVGGRRSASAMG